MHVLIWFSSDPINVGIARISQVRNRFGEIKSFVHLQFASQLQDPGLSACKAPLLLQLSPRGDLSGWQVVPLLPGSPILKLCIPSGSCCSL